MNEWIPVNSIESFINAPRQYVDVHNLHIAVVKLDDLFCAFESVCSHAMYELDDAPIEDETITCPLHGAKFCIRTGEVLSAPAYEGLRTFPVRIVDGTVQIAV